MRTLVVMMAAMALSMAVGCSNNTSKKSSTGPTASAELTSPAPIEPIQPVQPVQPLQPVVSDTPATVTPVTMSTSPAPAPRGGNVYVVQKGDTLFKIARTKYGDASAVKKIKEANPGIDADHIKAGQKINLP